MQPDAHKRALIAGSIGNFIEWYEFAVYGFLATVIAKNFFQLEGEAGLTSLILTYASFAIAFFFRPLGAVVFGRIGDRIGRKPTLIIVLVLMTLATAAIGIVPVYASIGIAAPLIVTLLRILQGLFAGGEYGGAVSLMTEFAPRGKRGLYGAWQSFTVALGLLAGAGIVALLSALLTPEALHDWGWRIPFFLALPMGAVALWLRVSMEETPSFVQQQDKPAVAQADIAATLRAIVMGIGRVMVWSAAGYTYLVIMPTYLQSALHTGFNQALLIAVISNVGFALTIIPSGSPERPDRAPHGDDYRHRAAAAPRPAAAETSAGGVQHAGGEGCCGTDCGRSGGHAGGAGPGDALRDVPDPRALYGAGAGLLVIERDFLGLCGVNHNRAD